MKVEPKYVDPSIEFYTSFAKALEEIGILDTFNDDNDLRFNLSLETVVDTDYRRVADSILVRMYDRGTDKGIARWFYFKEYEMMNPNMHYEYVCNTLKDMFKQITEG